MSKFSYKMYLGIKTQTLTYIIIFLQVPFLAYLA